MLPPSGQKMNLPDSSFCEHTCSLHCMRQLPFLLIESFLGPETYLSFAS